GPRGCGHGRLVHWHRPQARPLDLQWRDLRRGLRRRPIVGRGRPADPAGRAHHPGAPVAHPARTRNASPRWRRPGQRDLLADGPPAAACARAAAHVQAFAWDRLMPSALPTVLTQLVTIFTANSTAAVSLGMPMTGIEAE